MMIGDEVQLRGGQVMRVAKISDGIVTLKWRRGGVRYSTRLRASVAEYLRVKV